MPKPKRQKGDQLEGRNKIFGAAVEGVHVGIGFSALGNFTMRLQGTANTAAGDSHLHAELDELVLTYTTPAFRAFRYEVQKLSRTRNELRQYQARAARILLENLSRPSDEAFLGFLRASVAFFRDLGADALPFFEPFHAVVNRSLLDEGGFLIASTERLQLIFLAQVAWLRDIAGAFSAEKDAADDEAVAAPEAESSDSDDDDAAASSASSDDDDDDEDDHDGSVDDVADDDVEPTTLATIAGLYLRQALDAFPVVRRLAMETLATLARRVRDTTLAVADVSKAALAAADSADIAGKLEEALATYAFECMVGLQGTLSVGHAAALETFCSAFSVASETRVDEAAWPHRQAGIAALQTAVARLLDALAGARTQTLAVSSIESLVASVGPQLDPTDTKHVPFLATFLRSPEAMRKVVHGLVPGPDTDASVRESANSTLKTLNGIFDAFGAAIRDNTAKHSDAERLTHCGAVLEIATKLLSRPPTELPRPIVMAFCRAVLPPTVAWLAAPAKQGGFAQRCALVLRFLQDLFEKNESRRQRAAAVEGAAADAKLSEGFLADYARADVAVLVNMLLKLAPKDDITRLFFVLTKFDAPVLAGLLRPTKPNAAALKRNKDAVGKPALVDPATVAMSLAELVRADMTDAESHVADAALELARAVRPLLSDSKVLDAALSSAAESTWSAVQKLQRQCAKGTAPSQELCMLGGRYGQLWAFANTSGFVAGKKGAGASADEMLALLHTLAVASLNAAGSTELTDEQCFDNDAGYRGAVALRALTSVIQAMRGVSSGGAATLTKGCADPATARKAIEDILLLACAGRSRQLRIAALELLADLHKEAPLLHGAARALLAAESVDPLAESGNIDAKQQQLTQLSFRATSGAITEGEARIAVRAMIGLWHVPFAAVWPVATTIIVACLKQHRAALWPEVGPLMMGILLATDSATTSRAPAAQGGSAPSTAAAAGVSGVPYTPLPSVEQQALAQRATTSGSPLRPEYGDWTTAAIAEWFVSSTKERTTDGSTAAKTMLAAFADIVKDAANAGQTTAGPVRDAERWALMLLNVDSLGLQSPIRGLDDRLVLTLKASNASGKWSSPQVKEQLRAATSPLLGGSSRQLQRSALDTLRRLKVRPFDAWHAKLAPFTEPNAKLMAHLNAFHATDVDASVRARVVGLMVVLSLPRFEARSGDNVQVLRRLMSCVSSLESDDELRLVTQHALASLLSGAAADLAAEDAVGDDATDDDGSVAIEQFTQRLDDWAAAEKRQHRTGVRLAKAASSALVLVDRLVDALGARFEALAAPLVQLALHVHSFAVVGGAEVSAEGRLVAPTQRLFAASLTTSKAALARTAAETLRQMLEVFGAPFAQICSENANARRAFDDFLSRQTAALTTAIRSTPNKLPTAVALLRTCATGAPELRELIVAATPRPFVNIVIGALRAVMQAAQDGLGMSTEALYGSLNAWSALMAAAEDEPEVLSEVVVPFSAEVFATLCEMVSRAQVKGNTSQGNDGGTLYLNLAMWKEILRTVAGTAAMMLEDNRADDDAAGSASKDAQLGQMLDILLKFLSSSAAAADHEAAEVAASVAASVARGLKTVRRSHLDALTSLLNLVTRPRPRDSLRQLATTLCDAPHWNWWSEQRPELRSAFGRVLAGLNSFAESDDETEALSRYDFERRFHTTHAVSATLADATTAIKLETGAISAKHAERLAKKTATVTEATSGVKRRERAFTGGEDVTLPADIASTSRPALLDLLALLTSNLVFFLRDQERTVREACSQCLSAVVAFGAAAAPSVAKADAVPAVADVPDLGEDDDDAVASATAADADASFLDRVVRPWMLGSLRRGIVARDPAVRVEHMSCFGFLARDLPLAFPSFAALYDTNADRSFFALVGAPQHRLRLNALGMLRSSRDKLLVRDVLRVFVPFLIAGLKDFAQGKKTDTMLTQGRFQGYAEGCMGTMAHLAAALPWEAYQYVLTTMIDQARTEEALRAMLVKAIVRLIDEFRFLPAVAKSGYAASLAPDAAVDEYGDPIAAKLSKQQERIVSTLKTTILPSLMAFVVPPKKSSGSAALSGMSSKGMVHTAGGTTANAAQKLAKTASLAVQLRVSVAVMKLLKWVPEGFEAHAGPLLQEVVLKLRTKNDKHRISARKILGAMLVEVGPARLRFVVDKLRDNFVHGYQLHVLGYTVCGLLDALTPQFESECAAYGAAVKRAQDAVDPEDEDDVEAAKERAASRVRKPHLDRCIDLLLDTFMGDYFGELGAQKEAEEFRSSMLEVKKSRALEGFVYLARYCVAVNALEAFAWKIRWLLAPDDNAIAFGVGSDRVHFTKQSSVNKKLLHGEKAAGIDLRFLERVRLLGTRVARALVNNTTMEVPAALDFAREVLARNSAVRDAKIAEFEARDGTRRIRGNIERHTAQQRLTRSDQMMKNFGIDDKPERVDVDFITPTVLATGLNSTSQKQKLLKYTGRRAKDVADAGRSFAKEAPATAQELDVLDEFSLKLVMTFLQRLLKLGKQPKATAATAKDGDDEPEAEEQEPAQPSPARDDGTADDDAAMRNIDDDLAIDLEAKEPARKAQAKKQATKKRSGDGDESSSSDDDDGSDVGEQLEDRRALEVTHQATEGEANKRRRGRRNRNAAGGDAAENAAATRHSALLNGLVKVVIATLRGEGSDAVVTNALDVLHGLIAINPPLPSLEVSGDAAFSLVVGFIERGSTIKTRALRVSAALVSRKDFKLMLDDAKRLVAIARSEIIERSEFLPAGLSVLLSVVTKRVLLPEVFDIIAPVTELLLHAGTIPVVRDRCVAILAKFLTEYNITRDKLKSHVDLYLRNLSFPEAHGRVSLLDLLHVLVFRFPTPVLREEAPVMFVPLVHALASDESSKVREAAARVVLSLVANAGLDVFAPIMYQWLAKDKARFTDLAAQLFPFYVAAAISAHTGIFCGRGLASDNTEALDAEVAKAAASLSSAPDAAQAVLADVEWLLPHVRLLLARDHTATEVALRGGMALPAGRKRELESRNWAAIFYSLRTAEMLLAFAPIDFGPALSSSMRTCVLPRLIEHSHPWVQTAAIRLSLRYFRDFVDGRYKALTHPADRLDIGEGGTLPQLPLLTVTEEASAGKGGSKSRKKTRAQAEEEAAKGPEDLAPARAATPAEATAACIGLVKRIAAIVGELDVDEKFKHTVNKALGAPLRQQLQDLFLLAVQLVLANASAGGAEAIASAAANALGALAQTAKCILIANTIRGHVVRAATVIAVGSRTLQAAIEACKGDTDAVETMCKACDASLLSLVRLIGMSTSGEAKETNDRVHAIAIEAATALRAETSIGAKVTKQLADIQADVKKQRTDEQTRALHAKTYKTLSRENKKDREADAAEGEEMIREKRGTITGGRVRRKPTIDSTDGGATKRGFGASKGAPRKPSSSGAGGKRPVKSHRPERR